MPILQNSRHERFAQLVAAGMSGTEAYERAGYSGDYPNSSAARLSAKDSVSARISELKAKSEAKAGITRGEIIEILAEYARVHPMEYPHDVRLKAVAQLTKMCGWDAADKVELSADNELSELLKRLRGGGSKGNS